MKARFSLGVVIGIWWDFVKSTYSVIRTVWLLSRMPYPIVTIFGGTRVRVDDIYAKKAEQLARMLVQNNMAVLTGGGPGIMQAASLGAQGKTLGISVYGLDSNFENPYSRVVKVDRFYVRKWLLVHYSVGFIIFPGGIGTADELFGLLNDLKFKIVERIPVILIDKEYWRPLIAWLEERALKEGFIAPEDLTFITVVDDLAHAVSLVQECHQDSLKRRC